MPGKICVKMTIINSANKKTAFFIEKAVFYLDEIMVILFLPVLLYYDQLYISGRKILPTR